MIFKENYVYSEKYKNSNEVFYILIKDGEHAVIIYPDIVCPLIYAFFNWPLIKRKPFWMEGTKELPYYVTYTELGEIQPRWKIILTLGFCGLYKKTKKVHPAD